MGIFIFYGNPKWESSFFKQLLSLLSDLTGGIIYQSFLERSLIGIIPNNLKSAIFPFVS